MADLYEKLDCIGRGSFGEVFKGREKETDQMVALKLVDLEKADEEIDIIQREIKVMSQISNPYVVRYHTSLMKGSTLWIVMEFMSAGSLKELVDAVGPFPEEAIATVMKALMKGLDYIHREGKVHRDIKAANILLSDQGEVKLADFGVAGQMTSTVRQRNTFVGSPFWMAPEVIQESLYNEKADIWSAGITGLELANGLPPHAREHPYKALLLIPKNEPPRVEGGHFSRAFKDFIALCVRKNPSERPGAEYLLHHPFLKRARTASIKELLRQKDQSVAPVEEKVVIGGDSLNGSMNGTFISQGPPNAEVQNSGSIWEFDFDSACDSKSTGKQILANFSDAKPGIENLSTFPETSDREVETSPRGTPSNEDFREEVNVAPNNEILTELILPVISQIRADEDTSGSQNGALMTSLGSLEVAFVDAETAKPGISTLLLESILREALRSKSSEINVIVQRVLQARKRYGT